MEKTGIEYLLAINLVTFLTFALDKWKAVHNKWRIRESVLFCWYLWEERQEQSQECTCVIIKQRKAILNTGFRRF